MHVCREAFVSSWTLSKWLGGALLALILSPTIPARATPEPCVGDCGADAAVTVDEIVSMVNIALGELLVGECPGGDADQDGAITVDEIVSAVNHALTGCVTLPTPTPTAMLTPTPTVDLEAVALSAAELVPLLAHTATGINAVVSSLMVATSSAAFPSSTGTAAGLDTGITNLCILGGDTTLVCDDESDPPRFHITARSCSAEGPLGGMISFSGDLTLSPPAALLQCPTLPASGGFSLTGDVTFTNQGQTTLTVGMNLSGDMALFLDIFDPCFVRSLNVRASGPVNAVLPDGGGTSALFDDTRAVFSNPVFNADCVPVGYDLTIEGPAALTALSSGTSIVLDLDDAMISQRSTPGVAFMSIRADVRSDCLGEVGLDAEDFGVLAGELCPGDGDAQISVPGAVATIQYSLDDPRVTLDLDGDEEPDLTRDSCNGLLVCPAP